MSNININDQQNFAFNIWDVNSAKSVINAASTLQKNVILQTSTGIFKALEKKGFLSLFINYAGKKGVSAWLNIDHCRDLNLVKEVVDCDWDMVMLDMSDRLLEENIRLTNETAQYAHERGCLAEAEIGQVKGIEDDMNIRNSAVASRDDIDMFVYRANIDFVAVAFGKYKTPPILDYGLVEYTTRNHKLSFVVHGRSGLSDKALRKLISLGTLESEKFYKK